MILTHNYLKTSLVMSIILSIVSVSNLIFDKDAIFNSALDDNMSSTSMSAFLSIAEEKSLLQEPLALILVAVKADITCQEIGIGGNIDVTVLNAVGSLTYDWDDDSYDGMSNLSGLSSGTYGLTVTDSENSSATASIEILQGPCVSDACLNGELGGTVFIDYNANGIDDGNTENGPQGMKVQIFSCNTQGQNTLLETSYTDDNGDYHFSNPLITFGSGEEYRIEFSGTPDALAPTFIGSQNKLSSRFVTTSSCSVSYGLIDPVLYCQADAKLVVNCYADGPNTGNQDVLISIPYNVTPSGSENSDPNFLSHESVAMDIGATFGLAYQRESRTLFASAYLKRFSGFGPDGPGAIYKISEPSDGNLSGELFVDLNTLFGSDVAGADPHNFTTVTGGGDFIDEIAFNQVGRNAFGDMDISEDGTELFVVNLRDRSIYILPLGEDPKNPVAPTNSGEVNIIPLADAGSPLPNLPAMVSNAELIPFALKYRSGKLYVGLIANGQAGGDLYGLVYSYDFGSTTFTKELEFDLDYNRGCGFGSGSTCYGPAKWNSWLNSNVWPTPTVNGFGETGYPQPMLTDIEFDRENNMILGLRDRWGDQGGLQAPQPNSPYNLRISDAFGDILIANNSGGSWSINMSDFTDSSTSNGTSESVFGGDNYSAGGYYHEETAMGGLAVHHGYNTVVTPSMDPRTNAFSNGIDWFNLSNASKSLQKALTVLTGGTSVYGKSYGLGEIELICDPAPIHIGNYAWVDLNANGVQDPCEPPMENLVVKLYTKPADINSSPELVATTMTNSAGEYNFTSSSSASETWEENFDLLEKDSSYYLVFCGDNYNSVNGVLNSDGINYVAGSADTGYGENGDLNDSDISELAIPGVGSFPAICITTEKTNYTYDAGFVPKPDVAIVQILDPAHDPNTTKFGNPVKFLMTVYNQSILPVDSIEITDYIPAGFTFDGNHPGNSEWTLSDEGYPVTTITNLSGLAQKSTCIYLSLQKSSNPLDWINVVEISRGVANNTDIEDCDSVLDSNPDNNGGGLLGSDADDYIDGDGSSTMLDGNPDTDQDNVDPATVPVCDLALINKIELLPATIKTGSIVKYLVVVENQGSETASNIEVNYKIPEGLSYLAQNDTENPAWALNGNFAKATITQNLLAGEKDSLCIYLSLNGASGLTKDAWTTIAEISKFESPDDPGVSKADIDSTPNDDFDDDSGGNPDDGTDDIVNGDGSGDPDNPLEDADPALDEDDHDAAIIFVCDAAVLINTLDPGPFFYNDIVKFNVEIYNQGNDTITNIKLNNKLGTGLNFINTSNNSTAGWTGDDDMVTVTSTELLAPGESAVICLELELAPTLSYEEEAWLQIIEIESFEDSNAPGIPKEDIDSTPDTDFTNDSGGNPDDTTDDVIIGDGSGDPNDINDDANPVLDEDDHDPVELAIFDLALDKKVMEDKVYSPGEKVVFLITIFNQGNVDVDNYQITDYLRDGFSFSTTNNPGWAVNGDDLLYSSSSGIAAGGSSTIALELTVVVSGLPMITDWWNYAEISFADNDNSTINALPVDADSVPDNVEDNDNTIEPDDLNDNNIGGNGLLGGDHDDHDPAKIIVGYDLALIKTVQTPGPYQYGDTVIYRINIHNQGGLPVSDVSIYDTIPCGLLFKQDNNLDWSFANNIARITIEDVLNSGQNDYRDIALIVQKCALPAYDNYLNVAEIYDFKDEDGMDPLTDDIDSTPDDDPDDDDLIDDQLNDPDDEDDHDIAEIEICDLALINKVSNLPTPLSIYDTIKYDVIVTNQGNRDVNSSNINYRIPIGLKYLDINNGLSPAWNPLSATLANIDSENVIQPGESDTLCIYLELNNLSTGLASAESWTTLAEIVSFQDYNGDLKTIDADSTPDDDPNNDSGGNPDDDTNDQTDGDGSGDPDNEEEDSDPELDEDDHDSEIVYVCDVAAIIYSEDNATHQYGDILKYYVEVHNQGNGDISNIKLQNVFGEGLAFVNTFGNNDAGWVLNSPGKLNLVITDNISPGDTSKICLEMMLVPDHEPDNDSWLQRIEVFEFESADDPGVSKTDIDSDPDILNDNDSGGNTDDDTDDNTDGDGSGDPDLDIEDTDPNLDEDDEDPVDTKVFDLALKMQIDSMPPVLPVVPGDVMKFIIVVYNQGNTVANQVELTNFVMEENLFLNVKSKLDGWVEINSEKSRFTIPNSIGVGQSDTSCVYLEVVSGAMSDIITWAEISGSLETDGDCYDVDSTPNDVNGDDAGGNPDDLTDNHITDDGKDFNNDGITDEDDHDPAMLSVQDLALIVWADQKEPVLSNQDVKFIIKVTNQGNIPNKDIKIVNYIPKGFELSPNDDNDWTVESEKVVTKTLDGIIGMFDTITTCIVLKVLPGSNANDLVNYAEIVSSVNELGENMDLRDIDSSPNMLKNDDTGGVPSDLIDCNPFPFVIGDDNNISEAGINGEDEDDHDPAWVQVFDLATIIYTDETNPVLPGDNIKFFVDVHNQGNMAAQDVLLTLYMPDGFSLSNNNPENWNIKPDGSLELLVTDKILPDNYGQYCLYLTVNDDFTLLDLIPFVEISSAMDTLGNNRNDYDLDSDPDFVLGNDLGGLPDSDSDNQLDGTGLFGNDEDDHDPVIPPVMDLAIKIVTSDNSPKVPGDIAKFIVTVYNQGSLTPNNFTIKNYVPEGLIFTASPDNTLWYADGENALYEYTKQLKPFESDTLCIYLKVAEGAHPNNVVDMVEIASVFDDQNIDVSLRDIDSNADSSNDNDKGNDYYSSEDNKIFENGRSGGDEDDHDQAFVLLCQEMVCIGDVNLSLDGNCEIILSPAMFLEGDLFPPEYYEYYIHDEFGNSVQITSFDYEDIGKHFQLSIHSPICNNSCWMDVSVEYKLPPQIDCPPDLTLSCGALELMGVPPATGGCAPFEVFLFNESRQALQCDPLYTHIVTRTYKAKDDLGNESVCSHTVYIERIDLGDIYFPEPFSIATGNAISCGDPSFEFDSNGVPVPWPSDPSMKEGSGVPIQCDPVITNGLICPATGSGTGVPLIPGQNQQLCSAVVLYTDIELPEIGCVRKIMRTWEVREWWCNGENSSGSIQLLELIDDEAPVFDCPDDFSVSTNDDCAASVALPPINAADACGHGSEVRIDYPNGFIHGNGGVAALEVGVNLVTYIVNDSCYNTSSCSVQVTVADDTEPVAICEPNTVVSISLQGNTITAAEVYDDGSWDECGLHKFEVRRMDSTCVASDTLFGDFINFCCSDVGQEIMIVFRAIDKGGNYNDCMVRVEVQDKVPPVMSCPADMTIDCREAYDLNNLALTFGDPDIVDNCSDLEDVVEIVTPDVNQCGIGEISRKFELRDGNGVVLRTCKQHIEIINESPFVESNILWPLNYETVNVCGLNSLRPENLPIEYAFPIYTSGDDECSLLGYDYEDALFEAKPGTGECAHIERTWRVINWCSQVNGQFEVFEIPVPQVLVLTNTIAPVLLEQDDILFESGNIDCLSGDITMVRSASNDCPGELYWNYEIRDLSNVLFGFGQKDTISTVLPVGFYNVFWRVEDGCGNFDVDTVGIEVRNNKTPSPICIQGLSVNMEQWLEVDLNVNQVDGGSYHTCANEITLSMTQDTSIKTIVFNCDNIGINMIQLWVTDKLTGAQDFCSTFIDVQDGDGFCPVNGNTVAINGEIYTEQTEMIEEVIVDLSIPDIFRNTDDHGFYSFENMPMGGSYNVIPHKDKGYLNGVSTLDLILIQRHILGIERLDSPYKMIAADINGSGDISAIDLVELRKLILGIYNDFPQNTSWKFVDESYLFPDLLNPWIEIFPETYEIASLDENMFIDFIGVKIGDVNGSATVNSQKTGEGTENRESKRMLLSVEPGILTQGEAINLKIYGEAYEDISGWQGTFEFNPEQIEILGIEGESLNLREENVNISSQSQGWFSMSYNANNFENLNGEVLFEISLYAKQDIELNNLFSLSSAETKSEAYTINDHAIDLSMSEMLSLKSSINSIQPNPWVDQTKISFNVEEDGLVDWEFYDVSGRLLLRKQKQYKAGRHHEIVSAEEFKTSGVIYVKMICNGHVSEIKMLKIK